VPRVRFEGSDAGAQHRELVFDVPQLLLGVGGPLVAPRLALNEREQFGPASLQLGNTGFQGFKPDLCRSCHDRPPSRWFRVHIPFIGITGTMFPHHLQTLAGGVHA
jgi:hypothetical protein